MSRTIPESTAKVLRDSGWVLGAAHASRREGEAELRIRANGEWTVSVNKHQIGAGSETHVAYAAMAANEVAWAYRSAVKLQ